MSESWTMEIIISMEHQFDTCLLTCLFSMFLFCSRTVHITVHIPQLNLSVTTKPVKNKVGADLFSMIYLLKSQQIVNCYNLYRQRSESKSWI